MEMQTLTRTRTVYSMEPLLGPQHPRVLRLKALDKALKQVKLLQIFGLVASISLVISITVLLAITNRLSVATIIPIIVITIAILTVIFYIISLYEKRMVDKINDLYPM